MQKNITEGLESKSHFGYAWMHNTSKKNIDKIKIIERIFLFRRNPPKTDYTIYPEFFKTELTNPSESVKHFVTDER